MHTLRFMAYGLATLSLAVAIEDRANNNSRPSRFLTPKTRPFSVDGRTVPDVDFDLGESYAGLLPISSSPNETRKLFFWFFPSIDYNAPNETVQWFNGGPGCSSLGGLLSENGPFTWYAGTYQPVRNTYDWRNLTHTLWVEQPVGTGYTQGTANITNEPELADQYLGFYKQFIDLFGLHGWDIYLYGESYAGTYIPYIANEIIKRNDSDMPIKGIVINEPSIGDPTVQEGVTIQPFTEHWAPLLHLNDTFRKQFAAQHESCGYADYIDKYLRFPPPKGPFPVPSNVASVTSDCGTLYNALNASLLVNPCFNIYHITDFCPFLWSVVGSGDGAYPPDYTGPVSTDYFNRTDVKKAIHAPLDADWTFCRPNNVFAGDGSDQSLPPGQNNVLQTVVEHTNNVIIGQGGLDLLVETNGTLLALQNVTWNGLQGFQKYPNNNELFVPYYPQYNLASTGAAGILGWWGSERGLTFYQVDLSGHEIPEYVPSAAFRVLEVLLGRVENLSQRGSFTTAGGNVTGYRAG